MQSPQDTRIDLADLKVHIVKKIGVERSRRYFYYLGRFMSRKLTKSEFDKLCYRLLGRENLSLHNNLIRSILRNVSLAISPPPVHRTGHPDKSLVSGKDAGPEQSGSLISNHKRNDYVWSNGMLAKVRSGTCDRTIGDRISHLGPNGKVESLLHQSLCREDKSGSRNTEDMDLGPFAYQRSGRYTDEKEGAFLCPAEKMRIPEKGQVAAPYSRDDRAREDHGKLILSMIAPLRNSFCSASVGRARRTVPNWTSADVISCYDSGGLSDAEMLRKRMENIAVAQGLEGVTAECCSMLNNMLDVYLNKLMKSCIGLARARSLNGTPGKQSLDKQQSQDEIANGVLQEQLSVSLLDFRVAMELNPHQLGEDWPLLQERISICSFKEGEGV